MSDFTPPAIFTDVFHAHPTMATTRGEHAFRFLSALYRGEAKLPEREGGDNWYLVTFVPKFKRWCGCGSHRKWEDAVKVAGRGDVLIFLDPALDTEPDAG